MIGYPQSSSIDVIFHEINHPANLGYPHDNGKPQVCSIMGDDVEFLRVDPGWPESGGKSLGGFWDAYPGHGHQIMGKYELKDQHVGASLCSKHTSSRSIPTNI